MPLSNKRYSLHRQNLAYLKPNTMQWEEYKNGDYFCEIARNGTTINRRSNADSSIELLSLVFLKEKAQY